MSYGTPSFRLPTLTPAIKHLLIANAVVFVLNMLLVGRLSQPSQGAWLAFSWSGLWEGYGLGLVRIVTYQFAHAFADPMHFVMNMLVLYFFGTMAEARLGYRGTLKLYLIGGAVGALLHLGLASLQGGYDAKLVGASGACYAFLVYAAAMAPRATVIFIVFPLQLWVLAAGLVALGLYATFVEFATGYGSGTAHGAHLGGAALGLLAYRRNWFVDWQDHAGVERPGFVRGLMARVRQQRLARDRARQQGRQERLDAILDKVKQQGIGALSPAERRFLEQASKDAQKQR
ncbi:MAG TPA: rhomboid family intramembrane serine protease [bacterium]|nr:rhomboid family intramembrane serine protease [bacterium]